MDQFLKVRNWQKPSDFWDLSKKKERGFCNAVNVMVEVKVNGDNLTTNSEEQSEKDCRYSAILCLVGFKSIIRISDLLLLSWRKLWFFRLLMSLIQSFIVAQINERCAMRECNERCMIMVFYVIFFWPRGSRYKLNTSGPRIDPCGMSQV